MIEYLARLLRHMEWADGRTLAALRAASEPTARALALYGHVLGAEHEWLARLEGRRGTVAIWPDLALQTCADVAAENARSYARFLQTLMEADLGRNVAYTNSAGRSFETAIGDILLHVFLHGTYHRGQIAQQLRAAGAVPEPTDYIGFVRGVPAATRPAT